MDQKTQFIADYLRRSLSISELCTNYGISRKTGYKWIDRYLHDGPQGLEVNVSMTCTGECVGLEEIDGGIWNVFFGPLKRGRLLERHMRIEDADGRLKRHHL